ncbi:BTAD domain-containing putative transcriptional regulator [Longispora sp. NPDC051575]|uniref:AfsR/SARP family transcriptional regulator n=1 Tax=Longispora sp. NPDC051575 TaxID=3154943 RepID=UPI003442F21D
MEFAVLGPVRVTHGGADVPVEGPKLRTLLATLLLSANRPVSIPQLTERLWGDTPPVDPRRTIQVYVVRLRRALAGGGDLIRTARAGYELVLDADQLDLTRWSRLLDQAKQTEEPERRTRVLREALALWRGAACADVDSEVLHALDVAPLTERHLQAREQWIDLELELGRHGDVLPELHRLTGEHPLRERFWAQLALALYRSGRQADAMDVYWSVTSLLADQLGVDPGPDLRNLYQAMVAADPRLDLGAEGTAAAWVTACQLPPDLPDFVGRADLRRTLEAGLTGGGPGVPVLVLSGPPGVGKSTLAVSTAHGLRARFPDGVWHVDLAGAGPLPRDPADVLGELLEASGAAASTIPAGTERRSAALRARLVDRRVLLVLDDAGAAAQVVPLLPGTSGNAVLVTSRRDLTGLAVRHAARILKVACLEPGEAEVLVARIIGTRAAGAEPGAIVELSALCGNLPLALRIAAANAAALPSGGISRYVAELRADDRLARLAVVGDPDTAVRAAFDLSYASLDDAARSAFRVTGLVPGPDFTEECLTVALGRPAADTRTALGVLVSANLVERRSADRYSLHDLLRLYAYEHARADPGHDAAWHRLCSWYLSVARAMVRFAPADDAGAARAREWLAAERVNLVALAIRAAEQGPAQVAWQLLDGLNSYLPADLRLTEWLAVASAARDSARTAGELAAAGTAYNSLSACCVKVGDLGAALTSAEVALDLFRQAGDQAGEAGVLGTTSGIHIEWGDSRAARDLLAQSAGILRLLDSTEPLARVLLALGGSRIALGDVRDGARDIAEALALADPPEADPLYPVMRLYRGLVHHLSGALDAAAGELAEALRTGVPRQVPHVHRALALARADQGQSAAAVAHGTEAVRLSRAAGRTWVEAESLNALGYACVRADRPAEALEHHRRASALGGDRGYRGVEAEASLGIARARLRLGEPETARRDAVRALELSGALGHRLVECQVHQVLADVYGDLGDAGQARYHAGRVEELRRATGYRPVPWRGTPWAHTAG